MALKGSGKNAGPVFLSASFTHQRAAKCWQGKVAVAQ
jgi:hypothetical protein